MQNAEGCFIISSDVHLQQLCHFCLLCFISCQIY